MLTGTVRVAVTVAGVMVTVMVTVGLASPAMAQLDPDNPCAVDPTSVVCEEYLERLREGDPGTGDTGGGNDCGPHNGVIVPCVDERLGDWLGTPSIIYGFGSAAYDLVGCWARRTGELPVVRPQPEWSYPIHNGELDTGGAGRWVSLSCLGPVGVWPDDVQVAVATVWLLTAGLPGPDPEQIARRALAQIGLAQPGLLVFPPATGSVPLGMPVWLAVEQTDSMWGPVSDEFCDDGLCVSMSARVTSVAWVTGDGSTLACSRDQNIGWRPGRKFLEPGSACHHYYSAPSRDVDGGRYQVSATASWRAEWSGGGESGVFEDVTDACGPGGDGLCGSTVGIIVEEIQVVGAR